MVRLRRRAPQQIGDELSEGLEHFRSAASMAAERAAETLGPRVDSAREALAPRVDSARDAMAPAVDRARTAATRSWESTLAPLITAAVENAQRATEETRGRASKAQKRGRHAGKEAKRRARGASLALRGEEPKRRWPWMLGALAVGAIAGAAGALVSRRSTPRWEEYDPDQGYPPSRPESAMSTAREKAGTAMETAKEKAGAAVETALDKAGTAKQKVTDSMHRDSGTSGSSGTPTGTPSAAADPVTPVEAGTETSTTKATNRRTPGKAHS